MSYESVLESLKNHKLVTFCVVSKGREATEILPLLEQGHAHFAENRPQEMEKKWAELKSLYPKAILHFIGHLQTNKVEQVLKLADVIHSLDRKNLALSLKKSALKLSKTPSILIKVNLGKEEQKSGVYPKDLKDLLTYCQSIDLKIDGLMCIPPKDAEQTPYFKELKSLCKDYGLKVCSQGMSTDYLKAIECGSTLIRVGRKCFE